ncbi:MAG: hypothetical protein ACRDBR_01470 [Metamycoplasmataceae bacterium]
MFSLVILISSDKKLNKFISHISTQTSYDFELILLVQNFDQSLINSISKLQKVFTNNNLKIIFNTRKISFVHFVLSSIPLISSKYVMFSSVEDFKSNKFVEKINNILIKEEVDILEFPLEIKGISSWSPKWRNNLEENTSYEILKTTNIVPYVFPFLFNKIIKTSILKKINELPYEFVESSSIWAEDIVYLCLLCAKTYKRIDQNINSLTIQKEDLPLLSKSIQKWNSLENLYLQNGKFNLEFYYAKLYFFKVVLLGFYSSKNVIIFLKNKGIMPNKIQNYINKLNKQKNNSFNISNPYMFQKNNETKILLNSEINTKTFSLLEE